MLRARLYRFHDEGEEAIIDPFLIFVVACLVVGIGNAIDGGMEIWILGARCA